MRFDRLATQVHHVVITHRIDSVSKSLRRWSVLNLCRGATFRSRPGCVARRRYSLSQSVHRSISTQTNRHRSVGARSSVPASVPDDREASIGTRLTTESVPIKRKRNRRAPTSPVNNPAARLEVRSFTDSDLWVEGCSDEGVATCLVNLSYDTQSLNTFLTLPSNMSGPR